MTGKNDLPITDTQLITAPADPEDRQESPQPYDEIPEGLVKAAIMRRLVPLVGAGISKHAALSNGESFPGWNKLLKGLADEAHRHRCLSEGDYQQIVGKDGLLGQGKHLMVAQTLCERLGKNKKYRSIIQETFDPSGVRPGAIHTILFQLGTPLILTTNYDRLLEHAYPFVYAGSPDVYKHQDADSLQRRLQNWQEGDPPAIFKIHGCVTDLKSIVLAEDDYRELHYRNPGYRTILSAIIVTHTILMMGFSFTDPDVRRLLATVREALKYSSQPHYILLAEDKVSSIEKDRYYEDFNLETITYKASEGHPELLQFVEELITRTNIKPLAPSLRTPTARITRRFINRDSSRSARILSS